MRKLWLQVHLWIALILGLVLALIGLSGSVLVLRAPILKWEAGAAALELARAPPPGASHASPETWKSAAQAAYPQLARVIGALPPGAGFLPSDNALVFGPMRDRPGMGIAMVDPYDASARAFFVYDDLMLARIVALHRALLLPRPLAGPAVAACGIALLVSLGTGAWLWWPRGRAPGRWRRALGLSRQSRGLRRWLELHNVSAAYLFAPLLVLTVTGTWLAQPGWFAALGLDKSFQPIASALHARLMLGTFGEILVFLAGLALPVLYVSGLAMWWQKRRARRNARQPASLHG